MDLYSALWAYLCRQLDTDYDLIKGCNSPYSQIWSCDKLKYSPRVLATVSLFVTRYPQGASPSDMNTTLPIQSGFIVSGPGIFIYVDSLKISKYNLISIRLQFLSAMLFFKFCFYADLQIFIQMNFSIKRTFIITHYLSLFPVPLMVSLVSSEHQSDIVTQFVINHSGNSFCPCYFIYRDSN